MAFKKVTKKLVGELLIDGGIITRSQLDQALERQKKTGKLLGETLVELGFATEENVASVISAQYRIPYLPLRQHDIEKSLLTLMPRDFALRHRCFPVDKVGGVLTIAMENPLDDKVIEQIHSLAQCKVMFYVATRSEILAAIKEHYGSAVEEGAGAPPGGGEDEIKVFQLDGNGTPVE